MSDQPTPPLDPFDDLAGRSGVTHIFLQWKGTDVCFDWHCECGGGGHFDGGFAYYVQCPDCNIIWEMPSLLALRKVKDGVRTNPVLPDRDYTTDVPVFFSPKEES
jgi:hypothetical protein